MKEFRYAIDEFSAALFLCPNHPILTFQICVGRVNAHNHSKRYEAAANDARLAIGVRPDISHGYSLLGRSLFYCKDYAGTIIALEESLRLIQPHEDPSVYDKAYLKKAQEALAASASDDATVCTVATSFTSTTLKSMYTTSSKSIPKLKLPRFVSREKIVAKGLNVPPPMPSKWPSQTTSPTAFQLGKIRRVSFGEGPLGIKVNRGCDGFVRILSIYSSRNDQGETKALRQGKLYPGDIVREAAGVDLRRPITNIMWGDTVALIKMAPKPMKFIVAKELSTPPTQVLDQLGKAAAEEMHFMLPENQKGLMKFVVPSPICGDEAVADFVKNTTSILSKDESISETINADKRNLDEEAKPDDASSSSGDEQSTILVDSNDCSDNDDHLSIVNNSFLGKALIAEKEINLDDESTLINDTVIFNDENDAAKVPETTNPSPSVSQDQKPSVHSRPKKSEHHEPKLSRKNSYEGKILGGDILFDIKNISCSLPIIPWSATESIRKLIHHSHILTLKKTRFFGEKRVPRILALFRNPSVILILRRPENVAEVRKLLDLPKKTKIEGAAKNTLLQSYFVAESVIDLALSKLRLSSLTTETSVDTSDEGFMNMNAHQKSLRANSFEIITPVETHWISLEFDQVEEQNLENLVAETSCWETALIYDLHTVYKTDFNVKNMDQGWKHQIVLGTLHSHVGTYQELVLEVVPHH